MITEHKLIKGTSKEIMDYIRAIPHFYEEQNSSVKLETQLENQVGSLMKNKLTQIFYFTHTPKNIKNNETDIPQYEIHVELKSIYVHIVYEELKEI